MTILEVFLLYVCPTIGSILSTIMFAAPVNDLRRALLVGELGVLDPFPFVFAAGNTLGWIVYGYFQWDPFLVAANLPGFLVSLWLNYGAAKVQYYQLFQKRMEQQIATSPHHTIVQRQEEERWDASSPIDEQGEEVEEHEEGGVLGRTTSLPTMEDMHSNTNLLFFVPQETYFFRMMCVWAVLVSYASWFTTDPQTASSICGWAVNANLVFFYGAPLHTIRSVIHTHDSSVIHRPTLRMSLINTSFWMLYGTARANAVVVAPNAMGFVLGLAQSALCVHYPVQKGQQHSIGVMQNDATTTSAISSIHAMTPRPISQDVDDFV